MHEQWAFDDESSCALSTEREGVEHEHDAKPRAR